MACACYEACGSGFANLVMQTNPGSEVRGCYGTGWRLSNAPSMTSTDTSRWLVATVEGATGYGMARHQTLPNWMITAIPSSGGASYPETILHLETSCSLRKLPWRLMNWGR